MTEPSHRMDPAIRTRWLAALRSGDYLQGRELLHYESRPDGSAPRYCCLGVLCDLAYRDGVIDRVQGFMSTSYGYLPPDGADEEQTTVEVSVLPPAVARWAGLVDADGVPITTPRAEGVELTVWNDGEAALTADGPNVRSHTFAEIADLIERSDL